MKIAKVFRLPVFRERRPAVRFSLRLLLLAMAVACISLGFYTHRIREYRQAIDTALEAGGFIEYAHQFPSGRWGSGRRNNNAQPPGPPWARAMLGDEYFVTVVGLQFWGKPATDADVANASVLTNLEYLSFVGGQIKGPGLAKLSSLRKLRILDLLENPTDDEGIKQLPALGHLESLDLRSTDISDSGLAHLEGFNNLTHLAIDNTEVTDAGVQYLTRLRQLSTVVARNTKITDGGFAKLQSALPNCRIIR